MAITKLQPPIFQGQNCINGVHIVRVIAPKFGSKATQTRIMRSMLHDVINKQGDRTWKIIRTDIIAEGKTGELDGRLILDDLVPGGLFFYSAVAHYSDGSSQTSNSVTPVQIP